MENSASEARSIRNQMDYYFNNFATPVIIMYGDTLWEKGWFGFKRVQFLSSWGDHNTEEVDPPSIKCKRGRKVTQDVHGNAFVGVGIIAVNLMEKDADKFEKLKLILDSDPNVAGIGFVTREGRLLRGIAREDVP